RYRPRCFSPYRKCRCSGKSFSIDLPEKKVVIESRHSVDVLLETLKKTGKNVSYVGEK
uniref:Uncharacterized protein n=1 Tax=Callorhinchus milii TaxID=7868 RepID=A0A4W3GBR9_CALMI